MLKRIEFFLYFLRMGYGIKKAWKLSGNTF